MKSKISAMMDGELAETELGEPLRALREDGEALEAWRKYHLIGDALRDTQMLSRGFSTRMAERLALEPTVLAPASLPRRHERARNRLPLSLAAGFAAVALVGALAFQAYGPQIDQVAQNKAAERAPVTASVVVPMPVRVNDYLLAHQHYSPRSTLQGVAPYVRTVSDSARPR
jgi:sigma-E factor negative regulatory protein RseA